MTIDQVRTRYEAHPFQPFILHLADGRSIPVYHHEFLATAPSGRTIIVYQPDNSFNVVDLLLVMDLEVRPQLKNTGQGAGPNPHSADAP